MLFAEVGEFHQNSRHDSRFPGGMSCLGVGSLTVQTCFLGNVWWWMQRFQNFPWKGYNQVKLQASWTKAYWGQCWQPSFTVPPSPRCWALQDFSLILIHLPRQLQLPLLFRQNSWGLAPSGQDSPGVPRLLPCRSVTDFEWSDFKVALFPFYHDSSCLPHAQETRAYQKQECGNS